MIQIPFTCYSRCETLSGYALADEHEEPLTAVKRSLTWRFTKICASKIRLNNDCLVSSMTGHDGKIINREFSFNVINWQGWILRNDIRVHY